MERIPSDLLPETAGITVDPGGELTAKKNMIWFRVKLAYTDGTSETVSSDDSCFIAFFASGR